MVVSLARDGDMPLRPGYGLVTAERSWNFNGTFMSQVSKALLIQSHALALSFTDKILDALSDEIIGWDVARALGDIAATDDVLTKKHHAVFRVCCSSPLGLKWILTSILATICPKVCQLCSSKNHRICEKFQR